MKKKSDLAENFITGLKVILKNKLIIRIFITIIVLILFYLFYNIGAFYGMVMGVKVMAERNNETMCDFMGLERDVDGFCLLSNETFEYRWYIDCGWEKFKIKGEKKPTFELQQLNNLKRIIIYPLMRC